MKKILLIALLSPLWLGAQELNSSRLDSLFQLMEKHEKAMGSVAISENGQIVYERAFGFAYADAGDTIPNTTETRFRIGSISKTFTATLVMHLVEEGKLKLSTPLSEFYPQIENAKKISIQNLLQHSSGLHNITSDSLYITYMEEERNPEQMLTIIREAGTDFEPGSQNQYSNSNYILLGYIIEQRSGQSYSDLLEKVITAPLQLENTYVGSTIDPEAGEAFSYLPGDGWKPATETDMSIPGGAGFLVSTPTDLLKFLHALRKGQIISQAYADQMKPQPGENFGLGLFPYPFQELTAYGHNGGIDGFSSTMGHFDEAGFAVAITLNAAALDINQIAVALIQAQQGISFELPNFKTVKLSKKQLDKLTGKYVTAQFPLDIKVFREGSVLKAQASGQPSFPLSPQSATEFSFDAASIKIEFMPKENKMIFKQGGQTFTFTRSK